MVVAGRIFSQDTLPRFTLTERGDRVTISWVNNYHSLIQLNVQRSYDSLKNFTTIYSAASPELPQNGYTDVKPVTTRVFYRIFYVATGGSYFFTKSKRATTSGLGVTPTEITRDNSGLRDMTNIIFANVVPGDKRMITVKMKDVVFRRVSVNTFRNLKDSILRLTKDTLYAINDTLVTLNQFQTIAAYRTSLYIYVNRDGFINISLPLVNEKKYSVKFFEENGGALFEIANVKESPLILDKSNFIHSGWFHFELYEDNKLKEKNKLFIPKDF